MRGRHPQYATPGFSFLRSLGLCARILFRIEKKWELSNLQARLRIELYPSAAGGIIGTQSIERVGYNPMSQEFLAGGQTESWALRGV